MKVEQPPGETGGEEGGGFVLSAWAYSVEESGNLSLDAENNSPEIIAV